MLQIGNKLKDTRKAKNLSQQELAKLSGVSQQVISNIESGRNTNPGFLIILNVCRALHCSVYDLVDEEEMQNVR